MAGTGAGRSLRVRAWIAELAAATDRPITAAVVCETAVFRLRVGGATLTVDVPSGWPELRHATDEVGRRLVELQVTVGEGPGADARRDGGPVLVADLDTASSRRRWPLFAPLAVEVGASALFVVPLGVGAIRAGQLALHRARAGPLDRVDLGYLMAFAELLLGQLLWSSEPLDGEVPLHDPQVHQATGMVAAQLGVGMEDAFVRLRARAFVERRPLAELSADVVARRVRFAVDGDGSP
jgi:hypothetical protein